MSFSLLDQILFYQMNIKFSIFTNGDTTSEKKFGCSDMSEIKLDLTLKTLRKKIHFLTF